MKRGPKPETPSAKSARGTLQPVRDALKVEMIVPGDPPQQPEYLTAEAIAVWQEVIGRVMSVGVREVDSALLARYCSTEAVSRQAFNAGTPPPAAYITALRQMEELLRIAGPRSRVSGGDAGAAAKSANPFGRNGRR